MTELSTIVKGYKINNSGYMLLDTRRYYCIIAKFANISIEDMEKLDINKLKNTIAITKLSGVEVQYSNVYGTCSEREFFEAIDALISR